MSILLIAAVAITTISHSISFHICGGKIENVALVGKANGCTETEKNCDKDSVNNRHSVSHKGCCQDAPFEVDKDKLITKVTDESFPENHQYMLIPVIQYAPNRSDNEEDITSSSSVYKPPLVKRDIITFVQEFLI